jgi:hypothetical protein
MPLVFEDTAMKVVFDISNQQIAIEGDGAELISVLEKAREIAPMMTEINIITSPRSAIAPSEQNPISGPGTTANAITGEPKSVPTIKEFGKSVSPGTASERIATIAAYVKRFENRETFRPKEMSDWFTHCGFQKPAQMGVALQDTKSNSGFIENTGYGKWKITPAGENFVTRKLEQNGGAT